MNDLKLLLFYLLTPFVFVYALLFLIVILICFAAFLVGFEEVPDLIVRFMYRPFEAWCRLKYRA